MSLPTVTVLVPARDEAAWIEDCIAAIARQDYPLHLVEVVVVVDGASADATDGRAEDALALATFGRWSVIRNDGTGTPGNLNRGLASATGAIVCRVDARSRIPREYVRRCVEILVDRPEVAVVGGSQVAIASRAGALAAGIARALNNRWGMGLARYRRGAASGPADTVYLGAFRTADLRAAGGWNPEFPTNQDFEMNRRMGAQGLVWFEAGLPVRYVPRPDLASLHRQYARFGAWKVRYWRRTGDRPRPRQVALLAGVPLTAALAAGAVAGSAGWRRAAVVGSLSAAVAWFEVRGSTGPRGGPATHAWSMLASMTVAAGWLRGAWGELLRPDRR